MAKIEIDLDAYALPDDHRVFKCSPGKSYRFYKVVRDANAVFMDVRGLAELGADPREWDDGEALRTIAADRWSRELESRARGNQHQGVAGISKVDRRNLGFIKSLLFEGKKGDLVIVPAEGYDKEVMVGEFLTEPGETNIVRAKDGEYSGAYIGRRVAWRPGFTKIDASEEMISVLHTRTAFFLVKQSVAEEVYRFCFGNFIYRGRYVAEFRTEKLKFTAEDSAVVSMWLNGFDVLRHEMEKKRPSALLEDHHTFYDLGLAKTPDRQAAELRININSPGEIYVRSKTPFAVALMAMMALSGCSGTDIVDNGVTVNLKTVGAATTDCKHELDSTINAMAVALGKARVEQACGLGKRAEIDAQVTTGAALKPKQKKSN